MVFFTHSIIIPKNTPVTVDEIDCTGRYNAVELTLKHKYSEINIRTTWEPIFYHSEVKPTDNTTKKERKLNQVHIMR